MLPDNFHSSMSSRNSNNPNGLRPRQQQHRRQNSTPTAFRPANVQKLPPQQRQHAGHGHRRGLSLDIRQLSAQAAGQDFMVSTHTNSTGLANHSQHLLREAQQQRIQARPGTQNPYMSLPPSGSDQNLISPLTTPQLQADRFDQSCFGTNALSFASFDGDVNMIMSRAQAGFGDQIAGGRDFDLQVLNTDSALSTPTFASFQESPSAQGWTSEGDTTSTRRSSRRVSNGIMDRVNKYETLGFDGLPRPTTPPNQDASNYFPLTPMETPQGRLVKIEPRPSRFTDGYDESMEETIKPSRGRPNRRAQTIFQDIRQQTEQANINMLPQTQSFDGLPISTPDYMSMVNFNQEFMKLEDKFNVPKPLIKANLTFDALNNLECDFDNDTDSADLGATSGSDTPAPTMEPAQQFQTTDNMYELTRLQRRVRGRAHRRNQSEASIISNASVADVDPEKSKIATGISQEEIAKYMGEPDTPGGKYRCLFPDCPSTKFGRKENLKSHVQTHLGDRQYKCPSCLKCFVRQHDLKRHAKIHTGVKPFPCPCGNTFARQDALTRHRQRGMCIGAFEGCPVKESKRRGRPPKKRVDGNSESSSSEGPSDDSAATTPTFDDFNTDQFMSMTEDTPQIHVPMSSTAPMAATSPSPGFVTPPSYISPEAIMSSHPPTPGSVNQFVLPSHPATPGDAISPPGLTHSTSPTLSSAELDGGIIIPEMFTLDTTPVTTTGMMSTLTADIDDPDMSSAFTYTQTSMLADYESQLKFYNRPEDVFSEDPSFFDNSTFST